MRDYFDHNQVFEYEEPRRGQRIATAVMNEEHHGERLYPTREEAEAARLAGMLVASAGPSPTTLGEFAASFASAMQQASEAFTKAGEAFTAMAAAMPIRNSTRRRLNKQRALADHRARQAARRAQSLRHRGVAR
jgi:hypothetical protein